MTSSILFDSRQSLDPDDGLTTVRTRVKSVRPADQDLVVKDMEAGMHECLTRESLESDPGLVVER